ncbi:hypothetical protein BGZ70_003474 [Mortierella alpina]|uniref:Yeast cell wall synthesis Kre9/Knh1-like N-terminal domain-containing protein n=1 Tax=Mortierella alpina TaxID=64518 RepID=A0A9P6ISW2_MORAP|nr:hypothetical protein BGZ70_003474 [Mortierella alpina]
MKSSTQLAVLLSALASFATLPSIARGFVYPETPVGDTVWRPDSNVTISWSDDKVAPSLSSKPVFDIFLMTGSDDNQTKLATIASNVKGGTTKSVNYMVPHVSPPGQIYFLMFETKDGKGMAWATRFTITDAEGNPGTLKPRIPAGGKINPGGVGALVESPKAASAPIAAASVGLDAGSSSGTSDAFAPSGDLASIAVGVSSAKDDGKVVQNGGSIGSASIPAMMACTSAVMALVALMAF